MNSPSLPVPAGGTWTYSSYVRLLTAITCIMRYVTCRVNHVMTDVAGHFRCGFANVVSRTQLNMRMSSVGNAASSASQELSSAQLRRTHGEDIANMRSSSAHGDEDVHRQFQGALNSRSKLGIQRQRTAFRCRSVP
jgi:hypothetical protein